MFLTDVKKGDVSLRFFKMCMCVCVCYTRISLIIKRFLVSLFAQLNTVCSYHLVSASLELECSNGLSLCVHHELQFNLLHVPSQWSEIILFQRNIYTEKSFFLHTNNNSPKFYHNRITGWGMKWSESGQTKKHSVAS